MSTVRRTSKASLSSSGGYFGEVTAATPRTYAGRLGRAQGSKMSTSSKDSRPPPELEDAGVGGAFARLSEESELPEASIESVDVRPSMTQMQQVDFGGVQRRPSRRRTLWLGEQRVVAVTSAGARRILTVCWSLQFVVSAAFMILAWVATPAIFLNNNAEAVGVAFAWSIALRFFILEPLILRIASCCGPLGGRLFLDNILGVHAYTIGRHPDERHDPPAEVGVADDEARRTSRPSANSSRICPSARRARASGGIRACCPAAPPAASVASSRRAETPQECRRLPAAGRPGAQPRRRAAGRGRGRSPALPRVDAWLRAAPRAARRRVCMSTAARVCSLARARRRAGRGCGAVGAACGSTTPAAPAIIGSERDHVCVHELRSSYILLLK